MGSQFPNQGPNLRALRWEHVVNHWTTSPWLSSSFLRTCSHADVPSWNTTCGRHVIITLSSFIVQYSLRELSAQDRVSVRFTLLVHDKLGAHLPCFPMWWQTICHDLLMVTERSAAFWSCDSHALAAHKSEYNFQQFPHVRAGRRHWENLIQLA